MNKFVHIFSALAVVGASFLTTACNSDETYEYEPVDYSAVSVTGFSLKANKTVLNNLDSVFFSINLNTAEIYNADSLPYGTDVSRLGVTINTSTCSAATLHVPQGTGKDEKVYDYLTQADSLIDFSHGVVRFNIVSADGANNRDYFIRVNVHKVVPDSLYWSKMARAALPTPYAGVRAQKTLAFGEKTYCYTTDGQNFSVSVSSDLFNNRWTSSAVSFGKPVDLRSITATTDAMYALASDGTLLTSADGTSWSATGETWTSISAAYGDRLLGVKSSGGRYVFVEYPGGEKGEMPAGFPLSGASTAVRFDSKWSENQQIIIVGGRLADGSCSPATWTYAGDRWARLSSGIPAAEGYAVTNYTVTETDTVSWRLTEKQVTLAFGGRNSLGNNNTVYISRDMGVTWTKAGDLLQLPEYMKAGAFADIVVADTRYPLPDAGARSRAGSGWMPVGVAEVPSCSLRAVAPVTEWDCPFVYLFGGIDDAGAVQPYVWRGVVNHFTFRPLE